MPVAKPQFMPGQIVRCYVSAKGGRWRFGHVMECKRKYVYVLIAGKRIKMPVGDVQTYDATS